MSDGPSNQLPGLRANVIQGQSEHPRLNSSLLGLGRAAFTKMPRRPGSF